MSPPTSFIEWTADISGAHDLAIRNALSGFSFVALQPFSGPILFALNDSTTFATAVQGAPAVPEPGTFVLLLSAAAALFTGRRLSMSRT